MQKIDSNVVLRFILNDHAVFSQKARDIIANEIVETPIECICEVVYVLNGYYEIPRSVICIELKKFYEKTKCILPYRDAIFKGMDYFASTGLDFVDCLLAGFNEIEGDKIYTFDDKLEKLLKKITT